MNPCRTPDGAPIKELQILLEHEVSTVATAAATARRERKQYSPVAKLGLHPVSGCSAAAPGRAHSESSMPEWAAGRRAASDP